MSETVAPAQYLQIALDIAARIAAGELPEGSTLYGRSVISSEYGVSPETIRRALHLLADMKVVEIKPQSGVRVLSADSARRYIQNFGESAETRSLRDQLEGIVEEYNDLNRRLGKTASALVQNRERYVASREPLPNYEVTVPNTSPHIGKSIGTLMFWQRTGGTIVAIRRGQSIILSPGPYAELYPGDVIVLVGTSASAEAAKRFVTGTAEP